MVCFETQGTTQFLPGEGAVPTIGAVGKLERVAETKVEVLCVGKDVMTGAVDSLKRAHPYEEVSYEVRLLQPIISLFKQIGSTETNVSVLPCSPKK